MQEHDETALWAWFLFRSGLPTARAKALLEGWTSRGLTLRQALTLSRAELGISAQEAARLHPPAELPLVTALRWDNGYAPAHELGRGLLSLPLKLRPGLLFYAGDPALLNRPLVYLAPALLESEDRALLHEALSLLVDEPLLLGVYEQSAQVPVLLEEMAYSTGEAVIFARTGLDNYRPGALETSLIEKGRLVVVTPLPSQTAYQPAWDAVLQQVAVAAARRVLLTGDAARTGAVIPGFEGIPGLVAQRDPTSVLALAPVTPQPLVVPGLQATSMPTDVLLWVDPLFDTASLALAASEQGEAQNGAAHDDAAPYWVGPELTEMLEEELGPPPSAGEILDTLSKGGKIPEVLRRRLEEDKKA
jgi:hypothetical protein